MTKWNRFLKIIYRTSIFLLAFFILQPIVGSFIPLEFASDSIRSDFESFRFFAFILAILGTLTGTLKKCDGVIVVILKITGTLFAIFITFFIALSMALGNMCGYSNNQLLFINKNNSNTTIIIREFGCGATDSTPATKKAAKQTRITPLFFWVTSVDTNKINKENWIRADKEE
jgi:asparagine N-glycosylation enzyme membrane subunit Stt3